MSDVTAWFLKGINFDEAPQSLEELHASSQRVTLSRNDLLNAAKWEPLLQGKKEVSSPGWVPLEELASFRRGIATGANGFFLLSKERVCTLGISLDRCLPCVGRASAVSGLIYGSSDFADDAAAGGKLFLLNLTDPLSEAERRYVREGEKQSLTSRFLLANRKPWYSMEQRPVAPIWAAVFGRGDLKFVFNEAAVRSLTNFHCLYPNSSDVLLQKALTLGLNTSRVREASKMHGRVYGGGLNKFEPNDLKRIQVPDLRNVPSAILEEMAELLTSLDRNSDPLTLRRADELCSLAGEAATSTIGATHK